MDYTKVESSVLKARVKEINDILMAHLSDYSTFFGRYELGAERIDILFELDCRGEVWYR